MFYNGKEMHGEHEILRLSDAFETKDNEGEYEWTAHLLNINLGHNKNLMKHCKKLEDYAILIDKIRRYCEDGKELESAINQAVDGK